MPNEPPTKVQQPQQTFVIPPVLRPQVAQGNALVSTDSLQKLGDFAGDWLKRRYSAARTVARMKVVAFAALLAFLGLGFTLKLASLNVLTGAAGPIDFILTNPDPLQSISAAVCFVFVVSANLYSRWRTTEDEQKLLELAARPDIPPEVRNAVLKRLMS